MLITLVILLGLFIALLAIPVWVSYTVSWHRILRADATVQWAFGLVNVKIPGRVENPKIKKGRQGRSKNSRGNILIAVRQTAFRRRILRFSRDLWRALRKQDVNLKIRLGLGDPADTGQLWAVCGPLAGALASAPDVATTIEPDFLDQTLELDSSGQVRVIPLQVLYLIAALMLSPSVWRGVRQMRVAR